MHSLYICIYTHICKVLKFPAITKTQIVISHVYKSKPCFNQKYGFEWDPIQRVSIVLSIQKVHILQVDDSGILKLYHPPWNLCSSRMDTEVWGGVCHLFYMRETQRWPRHCSFLSATVSKLQSFLLQHQTFLEKCETWMEFLVQTEQKLAVEISGNYQHLLEQQRAHEVSGSSSSELTGGFRGQRVGSVGNGACCPAW